MHSSRILAIIFALVPNAVAFVPRPAQALISSVTRHYSRSQEPTRMSAPSASTAADQAKPKLKRAAIVGGGPTGALMALYLSQDRGFEVDVFEAMEESRIAGPTVRSWNIVLFDRATSALERGGVDLQQEVSQFVHESWSMQGRVH